MTTKKTTQRLGSRNLTAKAIATAIGRLLENDLEALGLVAKLAEALVARHPARSRRR